MNNRVMSHIWMSHVTRFTNTHESWVISHEWVTKRCRASAKCVIEAWHTYDWVMSHIWMSHVTHVNESCHTYEWVMSHIWMSHVTHSTYTNESWNTHKNELCHTHTTHIKESCHTHTTHMKESCHTHTSRTICNWQNKSRANAWLKSETWHIYV